MNRTPEGDAEIERAIALRDLQHWHNIAFERDELRRERDSLRAVNAELLAALQSAASSIEQLVRLNMIPPNNKGLRDARVAIAKAAQS